MSRSKLNHTIIIAEAGVNHNGSISIAKQLIDVAAEAGADFVKFQTFKAKKLVTKSAEKANYQKTLTNKLESQFEMIKKLELNRSAHKELILYCNQKKIKFLSTPFDHESIDLLDEMNIPFFKIPSGEITNLPYLRHIGSKGKPIVISTGMATMSEIYEAVKVLLKVGIKKDDLTILHCNTDYPTKIEDVNLKAMLSIKKEMGVRIGYSDHTKGIEIAIAAVAMGAEIIEKHFTLNRTLPGPDHLTSLEPIELNRMIKSIRNIEIALGNGIKSPTKSEIKNIKSIRKSIIVKRKIQKGDKFSDKNLEVKRPATGLSPMKWDEVIGKHSKKNYKPDEPLII